jgi:FAD/FMN-containing dehydrogenase
MDASLSTLSAFEMWNNSTHGHDRTGEESAAAATNLYYYVLVEAMGGDPKDHERIETALGQAYEEGLIADAVIAQSEAQRQQIWAMRDDVGQTTRLGPTFVFDVSMRISKMEAYVEELNKRLAAHYNDVHNFTFGHMGDGSLPPVISVGERSRSAREGRAQRVRARCHRRLGVGRARRGAREEAASSICRSRRVALMRALKETLDPKHILTPARSDLEAPRICTG